MFAESFDTKQMLEAILGSIDEAIHAVNAEGITIFYNHVASKHDGVQIDEVLGRHVLDIFPSLNKETSTLLQVIHTGQPIYRQPQTYKNIRGQIVDTVNTTLPIEVNSKIVGAVEIAKDLSTVKQLSQKLLDLQSKVERKKAVSSSVYSARYHFDDIISSCEQLQRVKRHAEKAASTSSPVMIYGETGTGKELFVQSMHNASPRKNQPFIAQNCAALPATLLESILFGTKKGSFTGAVDRPGLFELANGGTLFLDEVNSMPLELQAKLLRVLEDGIIRRVGGTQSYNVDVRIITALNKHPADCVDENVIRSDLYYRLNVFLMEIPPLRSRLQDIPLLTRHFIRKYNHKFEKSVQEVHQDVFSCFEHHNWPGNVRELEHTVEYAMNMAEQEYLSLEHLPVYLQTTPVKASHQLNIQPLRQTLDKAEQQLIRDALQATNGNIKQAAKLLDIPRQTLQYKLKKYHLNHQLPT
ncbi:sigma 54-interacting transcriptional regulator [Bacillus tianshenii]|nr:sigma 54-interacting transcriptional regulator [Bacillus tianshenii]